MKKEDEGELRRISEGLNSWMNKTFFGAPPEPRKRGPRSIPCPLCGKPMKPGKEACFFCRQKKD